MGTWSYNTWHASVSPYNTNESNNTRCRPWPGYDVNKRSPLPLPIRGVEEDYKLRHERKIKGYMGGGEPEHVGGFLKNDPKSFEPVLWTWMVDVLGAWSMIDVGCGRGISTKWFLDKGLDVTCVEGSPSGVETTEVPGKVIEHDYTKGPWWDHEKTWDFAWSCEFLEHMDVEYVDNYMATFARARLIFATHSTWGGWHHATIREMWWWIELFRDYGFEFMPQLTMVTRRLIEREDISYYRHHGMVFRNLRIPWKKEFEKTYMGR